MVSRKVSQVCIVVEGLGTQYEVGNQEGWYDAKGQGAVHLRTHKHRDDTRPSFVHKFATGEAGESRRTCRKKLSVSERIDWVLAG